MAMVLVVIGLLVGGVLTGQELISKAALRATASQVEQYNTAANTFREKTGYLPGDITASQAALFGFAPRGPYEGQGDGNGVVEGNYNNSSTGYIGAGADAGESVMFWVDLSAAHLIPQSFNVASSTTIPSSGDIWPSSTPYTLIAYLPVPKLGGGTYIYVWSKNGTNYFGFSQVTDLGWGLNSVPALTVQQAYYLDSKFDDGKPQSGRVTAQYVIGGNPQWAAGGGAYGASAGTVANPSSTTCYDNGGNTSNPMAYSVQQNNGAGVNCALSFQFQ